MGASGQRPNSFPVPGNGLHTRGIPGKVTLPGRGWFASLMRESVLVVFAILVYFLVRGMMASSADRAAAHAHALLDLERKLGIAWEADLQRWASEIPWLDAVMARLYIYGHWPVIALTLVWLFWRNAERLRTYRTAMVLSGLVGFAFFALYPVAPPRLLADLGFVDTVMRETSSYRVLQPPGFTNQYAALPSLHVGWNLLMGIAIFTTARAWYARVFAIVMPLLMYVSTVLTANHFVLDGIIGCVVALAGLEAAILIRSRQEKARAAGAADPAPDADAQAPLPPDVHAHPSPSNP